MDKQILNERVVNRYIPYLHHVTDQIISCDNNEYAAVIRITGRSPDAHSKVEQASWLESIHNVLRGLKFGQIGFYSHIVRRRITEYPDSEFNQSFARQFDTAYRQTFDKSGLMINELYLTVLIHPVDDPVLGKFASMEKANEEKIRLWQSESIETLETTLRSLKAALHRYDPEVLGVVDRDGNAFTETGEFLSFLLSGYYCKIPITQDRLREVLPVARPVFAKTGSLGKIVTINGERIFGMLELRDYPESTSAGHIDNILSQPYEFVLTQSWGSFTGAAAKKAVKKQHKLLVDSGDDSISQVTQLDEAKDDLTASRIGLGDHHATILVYESTPEKVRLAMANLSASLSEAAVGFRPLDRALEAGFWAQLPGNWHWRPRPVAITSYNFLSFSSFHNQLIGKPAGNPWGAAVTMLKTQTDSPYFFNFHTSLEDVDETGKRRPGNTMIIGMTGTGKTVLQGVLLTQAQKFDATCVVWDKDQGMQVLIMALGGRYFNIRLGERTGWNPFQMKPTKSNVAFLVRLVVYLAEMGGEPVTTRQRSDIAEAVNQLTSLIDYESRSISTLNTLMPNPYSDDSTTSTIHARLAQWCNGGEYGWVFDNPQDLLSLDTDDSKSALFGFDLTELLEEDQVRGAATMYLKHRIDSLYDGRKVINLYDECQHPLKDKHFQDSMQDDSRTIRKKNGVMAFATQEPAAITKNPVGSSLIQQSATMIFLPNPQAKPEDYIDGFGLTESEFELLKTLGEASRKFLIKQGSNVTVAQMDLSGCDKELMVFSGSPDMAELAEQAVTKAGNDPEKWLPVYYKLVKEANS